jgi:hypothetical protein
VSRSLLRLVLVVAVAVVAVRPGSPVDAIDVQSDAETRLLIADFAVNDGSATGELRELDLLTLSDLASPVAKATPASVPIPVTPGGNFVYREWLTTADGSIAITIDWPRGHQTGDRIKRAITVRAGIVGPVINEFEEVGTLGQGIPLGQPGATYLSDDGRRLVLVSEDTTGNPPGGGGIVWTVYDPIDGRQVAEFRAPAIGSLEVTAGFVALSAIDPAGTRLYRIAPVGAPANPELYPVQLVAYDLATGAEVGRLDLPDLLVGERNPSTAAATRPADTHLWPGFAISPDGRELAVVHPDGTRILLIDTATLTIARTTTTSAPLTESADRSSATPGATLGTRVSFRATYAAEGTHLLVTGSQFVGPADGSGSRRTIDLQRVDLTTGQVTARAPLDGWSTFWPTADGQSVYLSSLATDDPVTPGLLIRRLDAETLAVEAERTIPGRVYAVVWPRVPGCQLVTIWF